VINSVQVSLCEVGQVVSWNEEKGATIRRNFKILLEFLKIETFQGRHSWNRELDL
jgi:hypothetical protein